MIFQEDYMDIASELLSEMRLLVEGALSLFEDETPVLMRWARDNNEARRSVPSMISAVRCI